MNWRELKELEQLDQIDEESIGKFVLILKHSTRCSISDAALSRFERDWKEEFDSQMTPYYLDLLAHRDISNAIATRYGIEHQSPQVLLIRNGKCTYSETHSGIRIPEIIGLIG